MIHKGGAHRTGAPPQDDAVATIATRIYRAAWLLPTAHTLLYAARVRHQPGMAHDCCCCCCFCLGSTQSSGAGICVGRMPKRFLQVMRSRLNLSSGENRAGCADLVGVPSGAIFCCCRVNRQRQRSTQQ